MSRPEAEARCAQLRAEQARAKAGTLPRDPAAIGACLVIRALSDA